MPTENHKDRTYIAIDLKSFYSSVECVARGLDPLTTNLVVADVSRTEKTICLAVSPSMKAYGLGGRARLFEVVQKMREVNGKRRMQIGYKPFTGKSYSSIELAAHPDWESDYIAATPRMAEYIKVSSQIYGIYLKYIAPEDIHVYSIDEIFADVTDYLQTYKMTAHQLAMTMIRDVLKTTGITATAGIGTNLYLCKVAMDVVAKHIPADKDGVRIAELDEMSYRRQLWNHQPMTDFWRFGRGIVNRLATIGVDTMGKLARLSINNEELLYRMFGVNAELIIDHAWGWEPVTMDYIKAYKPETNSLGSGQVLQSAYTFEKGRVVAREMADALSLDLVDKHLVGDQIVLTVGYDRESLTDPKISSQYQGEVSTDWYGRTVPKHAHGTITLPHPTSSSSQIMDAVTKLYDQIVNPILLVRRLNITMNHVISEEMAQRKQETTPVQLDLFTDYEAEEKKLKEEQAAGDKERRLQEATLKIKKEFGKNALLRGLNFADGATQKERNNQIGGHKA
jgi:DNA polymerase V